MLKSLGTNDSKTINIDKLRVGLQKVGTKLYETETTDDGAGMIIPRADIWT
jgi:hypothetical protein